MYFVIKVRSKVTCTNSQNIFIELKLPWDIGICIKITTFLYKFMLGWRCRSHFLHKSTVIFQTSLFGSNKAVSWFIFKPLSFFCGNFLEILLLIWVGGVRSLELMAKQITGSKIVFCSFCTAPRFVTNN